MQWLRIAFDPSKASLEMNLYIHNKEGKLKKQNINVHNILIFTGPF